MSEDGTASAQQDAKANGSLRTPPYVSFKTFQTLLEELKTNGIPPQLDRSVLHRFAGGVQGQLMSAMKSLGLVDDNSKPTAKLPALVRAFQTPEFGSVLGGLLREVYPYVFSLDLMTATPSMFAKAFSDNSDAKEEVLRKCRTFFLHAAKEAGVPLGTRIENAKFPRARGGNGSKRAKVGRSVEPKEDQAATAAAPASAAPVITEKALEYRLVDLMSDAADDAETMASIIKVITFLKTREANKDKGD